ncbi:MAG: beta-lactamase family protein [Thiotrichales bacterium]|nr:MAG: beta-lactamase family protein [Thiotrichales bacterium]
MSLQVTGPGLDFSDAAGVANLITPEMLTPGHSMYAASIGKTFTAVIALQLCEEGRLELNAPISAWLADDITRRIPSSRTITLHHLLSHTSGLIDYMNDEKTWRSDFANDPHRQWTHRAVLTYLYDKRPLFAPGSDYHYSNSNYILAGVIIERVTGQPLHALIRERIIEPLGLQQTFNGQEAVTGHHRAHGYVKWRGRILDTYPWYSHYGLGDSGMNSTPRDLARFINALFETDMLLSKVMKQAMTSVSARGHPPSDYGLGIYHQHNPWGAGYQWYAHDGIDPGYQADMMYLPDLDLTIVLAANASMGTASDVYEKLIRDVVQVALGAVKETRRKKGTNWINGYPAKY